MPITPGCQSSPGQHVRGLLTGGGDLRLGLEEDPRLDVPARHVGVVELAGDLRRARLVVGQQQLDAGVRAVHPPGGVDPRREPEPDGLLVEPRGIGLADAHQRAQAFAARARERDEALAHEPAVLAAQRDAVGDRRERDDVEIAVGERRDRVPPR